MKELIDKINTYCIYHFIHVTIMKGKELFT